MRHPLCIAMSIFVRQGRVLLCARSGAESPLEHARHVDHHNVAMGIEPGVRSQLAGPDLKLQFHLGSTAISCDPTLADIGRAFGEGSDEGKDGRSQRDR